MLWRVTVGWFKVGKVHSPQWKQTIMKHTAVIKNFLADVFWKLAWMLVRRTRDGIFWLLMGAGLWELFWALFWNCVTEGSEALAGLVCHIPMPCLRSILFTSKLCILYPQGINSTSGQHSSTSYKHRWVVFCHLVQPSRWVTWQTVI